MSDFLLGVASFALVLIPLVILHELGHFIAAKLVGITVLEFGLGFPPRAKVLFTHGGTEYTLNWLPFGGFVRPYGEDFVKPKSEDEMSADRREIMERGIKNAKSVFQAGPWERMFFMAAGPGMNFIVALVLFILVGLIGQPFARADVTVYDLMPDSPAAEAGLQRGDVILELNGEEVESADDFGSERLTHRLHRGRECQTREKLLRPINRQRGDLMNRKPVEPAGAGFRPQPRAAALAAGHGTAELSQLAEDGIAVRRGVVHLQVGEQTGELAVGAVE